MKPICFSRKGRFISCVPSLRHARIYVDAAENQYGLVAYAYRDRNTLTDSFADTYSITETSETYQASSRVLPVIGKIKLHETGNGRDDALLRRVIIEAVPNRFGYLYEYDPDASNFDVDYYAAFEARDPYLYVELRNRTFETVHNIVEGQIKDSSDDGVLAAKYGYVALSDPLHSPSAFDMAKINMQVNDGVNVYKSVLQTPFEGGGTTERVLEFDAEWSYNAAPYEGSMRESMIFMAPGNSKFRKCTVQFESFTAQIVRAIYVEYAMHKRKGYG